MQQWADADDATLVLLAVAGERRAFTSLVRRHQHQLVNLLWRITGDLAAAEDAAQIGFVKAWTNLARLDRPERFRAWLRTIAVRAALDGLGPAPRNLDEGEAIADPKVSVARAEQRLDLVGALAQLTAPQRACVLLAHAEGLSHVEIAEALAVPVGTVKSHLARALVRLRALLSEWRPADG